jgi:chromosome segregation ATPase
MKKRIEVLKKTASATEEIEIELVQLQQKEKEYGEAINELHKEIEILRRDDSLLRKEIKKWEQKEILSHKRAAIASITETIRSITPPSSPLARTLVPTSTISEGAQIELSRLQHAVEFLRTETTRLRLIKSRLDSDLSHNLMNYSVKKNICVDNIRRSSIQKLISVLEVPSLVSLEKETSTITQQSTLINMRLNYIHTLSMLASTRTALAKELDTFVRSPTLMMTVYSSGNKSDSAFDALLR